MFRPIVYVLLAVSLCVFTGCRTNKGKSRGGETIPHLGEGTILEGDDPLPNEDFAATMTRIRSVRFDTVQFAYDSFKIAPSEMRKIEAVARYMRSNRGVRLVSEGHCDERGSKEYNLSLGENRALAVRAYLAELGVTSSHVQTRSYGEEQPVNPGHNESAWRQNRRVEFALYK